MNTNGYYELGDEEGTQIPVRTMKDLLDIVDSLEHHGKGKLPVIQESIQRALNEINGKVMDLTGEELDGSFIKRQFLQGIPETGEIGKEASILFRKLLMELPKSNPNNK